MAPRRSFKQQIVSFLFLLAPAVVLGQSQATDALHTCLEQKGVQVTISTDSAWTNDTTAFQFRVPRAPAAVTFPRNRDEVAIALACARSSSVKVSVVGRAHSFQGYAFGNPGNLVIDMGAFTELSFDAATKEMKFGGGANVGPAAKFLWDTHGRQFSHVRFAHVGLAGSTMGGGYGTTSRLIGTPVDNLASVELMLANGSVVTAGRGSDLLWAAQGAGPSFGVVLSAKIRTHPVTYPQVVNYTLALGAVSVDTASAALVAIQKFAISGQAPDELSLRFTLPTLEAAGFFYGDPAKFDQIMAPLMTSLSSVAPTARLAKTTLPFWDSEIVAAGAGMNSPTGGTLGGRASLVQSWVTTSDNLLTLNQVKTLLQGYQSLNRTGFSGIGFMDLWGGFSRNVADKDTSFAHGKNLWLIRVDGVATSGVWPSDGVSYMHNLMKPFGDALKQTAPLRSFVNYVDSELSVKDWSQRLYGANFARLQGIKARVDPSGVFSGYGLAIPAARRRRN